MRDEMPPGTVERMVQESEPCGTDSELGEGLHILTNGFLGEYAEELAARLTANLTKELTTLNHRLVKQSAENASLTRKIETEREALVTWLAMRISQQRQALGDDFISSETKRIIEIEVGLLERYQAMVLAGSHRPDPALLGTW
jgi:hypothetical protein